MKLEPGYYVGERDGDVEHLVMFADRSEAHEEMDRMKERDIENNNGEPTGRTFAVFSVSVAATVTQVNAVNLFGGDEED